MQSKNVRVQKHINLITYFIRSQIKTVILANQKQICYDFFGDLARVQAK